MKGSTDSFKIVSLIWSVVVPTFFFAVGMGTVVPVLPIFAGELGAGLGLIGVVVAMRGIGTLVFDLPAGILVSALSHRRAMLVSAFGAALVALGIGFSRSLIQFGVLNFLIGSLEALWMISRISYIREVVPARRRGRTLALMGGLMRLGRLVGPVLGGVLGKRFGLAISFFTQAVLMSMAFLFVLLFMNPREKAPEGPLELSLPMRIARTLTVHRKSFFTTGSAMVLLTLVRSVRQVLIPLWGDGIGLDIAAIGLIMGLSFGVEMTLFYPVGVVMDRLGRKWTAVPCFILLSLSLALVPLTRGFSGLLAVSLLAGFGNGLGSGINMTLGSDLAPRRLAGEFLGVWRLIGDIGTASGPLLMGLIAHTLSLAAASVFTGGLGILGVGIMVFLASETLPNRPESREKR